MTRDAEVRAARAIARIRSVPPRKFEGRHHSALQEEFPEHTEAELYAADVEALAASAWTQANPTASPTWVECFAQALTNLGQPISRVR